MCPHGRSHWAMCPWCTGLNDAAKRGQLAVPADLGQAVVAPPDPRDARIAELEARAAAPPLTLTPDEALAVAALIHEHVLLSSPEPVPVFDVHAWRTIEEKLRNHMRAVRHLAADRAEKASKP